MICADTTVLIDEFRARGNPNAPVNQALLANGAEILSVPFCVAGEFLDGAATVSEKRFQEALRLLMRRNIVHSDMEVCEHYGRITSELRQKRKLGGRSRNDLWIAATCRRIGARLLTRNPADFSDIPGLDVITY